MKTNVINDSRNPSFNSVLNLTNRTFDGNIVEGRGATEDQLLVVYNKIKEVKEWLDENGCDNDPYTYLRQQIEELQVKFEECCGTDWSANVTADMYERMQLLEDRIDVCCDVDHGASATAAVHTRLDELESKIDSCCESDHGEEDINALKTKIDELEQQVTDCCEALDERVQHVIDNVQFTPANPDGGVRDINVGTCDPETVSITYNVNSPLKYGYVGEVNYTINNSNTYFERYLLIPAKSDGSLYRAGNAIFYVGAIKFEQYRDICLSVNGRFGGLTLVVDPSGISDERYANRSTNPIITDTCGYPIIGPNMEYTRLFVGIRATNGCKWLQEIPLSAFDFSQLDLSVLPVSGGYSRCTPLHVA